MNRHRQRVTFRSLVEAVVASSDHALTGKDVAARVGAPYKPTIYALQALRNAGRVRRIGHKLTARWARPAPATPESIHTLTAAMTAMTRKP